MTFEIALLSGIEYLFAAPEKHYAIHHESTNEIIKRWHIVINM